MIKNNIENKTYSLGYHVAKKYSLVCRGNSYLKKLIKCRVTKNSLNFSRRSAEHFVRGYFDRGAIVEKGTVTFTSSYKPVISKLFRTIRNDTYIVTGLKSEKVDSNFYKLYITGGTSLYYLYRYMYNSSNIELLRNKHKLKKHIRKPINTIPKRIDELINFLTHSFSSKVLERDDIRQDLYIAYLEKLKKDKRARNAKPGYFFLFFKCFLMTKYRREVTRIEKQWNYLLSFNNEITRIQQSIGYLRYKNDARF